MIAPNASTAAGDRAPIASVTASNLKIIGKGTLKATVDLTISRQMACPTRQGRLWRKCRHPSG
jgi:hypothetical protein